MNYGNEHIKNEKEEHAKLRLKFQVSFEAKSTVLYQGSFF